ncbi:hypothetical protein ACQ1Q5_02575 [Ornithobacterium rhinotracheale]
MLKKKSKFKKSSLIKAFAPITLLFISCSTTNYIPQFSKDKNLEDQYIYTLSDDGEYHYVQRDVGKKISVNKDILVFATPLSPKQNENGVSYEEIYKNAPFTKALQQSNENFFKKRKNIDFKHDPSESSFLNPQVLYSKKENEKNVTVRMGEINFKWDIKLVSKKEDKVEIFGKKAIGLDIKKEGCLSQFFFFVYKNMGKESAEKIVRKNYRKFLEKYTPEDCTIKSLYRELSELNSFNESLSNEK